MKEHIHHTLHLKSLVVTCMQLSCLFIRAKYLGSDAIMSLCSFTHIATTMENGKWLMYFFHQCWKNSKLCELLI